MMEVNGRAGASCDHTVTSLLCISPVTLGRMFVCSVLAALVFLTMRGYSLVTRATLCLWCVGFSLGWLLFLLSRDSRHLGSVVAGHLLSYLKARGIFPTGDRAHVTHISMWILISWTTREVLHWKLLTPLTSWRSWGYVSKFYIKYISIPPNSTRSGSISETVFMIIPALSMNLAVVQ